MDNNKPKILIIDDEYAIRSSIEIALGKEDYRLFFAENGEEGISILNGIDPVLVLLDLYMPVMGGIQFLQETIVKPESSFSVIVLTGHVDQEKMNECYDLGVSSFLKKPFDVVELCYLVKSFIKSKLSERRLIKSIKESETTCFTLSEKELQQMHINKMASIGILAAGVAHEINNPLNIALGDIHIMKRDVADLLELLNAYSKMSLLTEEVKKIEKIKEAIDFPHLLENIESKTVRCESALKRINKVVNKLKTFSHLDKGKKAILNINKSIENALDMVPGKFKNKIVIKKEFTHLPEISCNGRDINQVFFDVILNSLQAMKGKGTLTINTKLENNNTVFIEFSDTGEGIPEEKIKHVFDPFFTTKPVGQGTGLGLAACYGIIKKHGGIITAANNPGKGAAFVIMLPRVFSMACLLLSLSLSFSLTIRELVLFYTSTPYFIFLTNFQSSHVAVSWYLNHLISQNCFTQPLERSSKKNEK